MRPTFSGLLWGSEKEFDQLVQLVTGELAGDGNIFDRMVSAPGAQGLPEDIRRMIEFLREAGVKPEETRAVLTNLKYNQGHPHEWEKDKSGNLIPPRPVLPSRRKKARRTN